MKQILAVFFRKCCGRDRGLQGEAIAVLLDATRGVSVRSRTCIAREVGGVFMFAVKCLVWGVFSRGIHRWQGDARQ